MQNINEHHAQNQTEFFNKEQVHILSKVRRSTCQMLSLLMICVGMSKIQTKFSFSSMFLIGSINPPIKYQLRINLKTPTTTPIVCQYQLQPTPVIKFS